MIDFSEYVQYQSGSYELVQSSELRAENQDWPFLSRFDII